MSARQQVIDAIRASWSRATSGVPDEWTPQNPARGQCDASSFVFWDHFGGNLVLAEVFVNGERTEHHYWNRIDGEDFDLTSGQFGNGETINEKDVMPDGAIRQRIPELRAELRDRIELMRRSVDEMLTSQATEAVRSAS